MALIIQWAIFLWVIRSLIMDFSTKLLEAKLVKRYKRFLADVVFSDGKKNTIYCPNPGSMIGLKENGCKVWVQKAENPKAKFSLVWKLVENSDGTLVCIDTQIANKIVFEALFHHKIPGLENYTEIITEPKIGDRSRLDFLVNFQDRPSCYLEVKSVTLSRLPGIAEFPDSVTSRGSKHLKLLTEIKSRGFRAIQLYVVQRNDANFFKIAEDIDQDYNESFVQAKSLGVEIKPFRSEITTSDISLGSFSPKLL